MIADHAIRRRIAQKKLESILGTPSLQEVHGAAQDIWNCFTQMKSPRYQQIYGALALISAGNLKEASTEAQHAYEMHTEANGEEQIMEALRFAPDLFAKHSDLIESKGLFFENNRFFAIPNEFRPGQPLQLLTQKVEPQNQNIMGALILHVAMQSTISPVYITPSEVRLIAALLLPEGAERDQKIKDSLPTAKKFHEGDFFRRGHDLVEILCNKARESLPAFVKEFRNKLESDGAETPDGGGAAKSKRGRKPESEFSRAAGSIKNFTPDEDDDDTASAKPAFEKGAETSETRIPTLADLKKREAAMDDGIAVTRDRLVALSKQEKITQEAARVYLYLQGQDKDGGRRTAESTAAKFNLTAADVNKMVKTVAAAVAADINGQELRM